MTISFQHHHGAMLLKYSGISFISGAVNHGFFSGERSLWTAAIGIVLFVLGAAMEHLKTSNPQEAPSSLLRTLGLGTLLSIGLGFFTGGLQHFPDSPARSAWVVPLGFFLSVLALAPSGAFTWLRSSTVYLVLAGLLVSTGSFGAWQWLLRHPQWAATGHAHGDVARPAALVVSRSIEVRMDDQMRFTPSSIYIQKGETIRFVVHNAGQSSHEMVLGSDADIRAHAEFMQQTASHGNNHDHGTGIAITVAPGETGELVAAFTEASTLQMACLIPGHYDAGMRGTIQVGTGLVTASASPSAGHDHNAHKH